MTGPDHGAGNELRRAIREGFEHQREHGELPAPTTPRPADWSSTWRDDTTGAGVTRDEAIEWAHRAIDKVAGMPELADSWEAEAARVEAEAAGTLAQSQAVAQASTLRYCARELRAALATPAASPEACAREGCGSPPSRHHDTGRYRGKCYDCDTCPAYQPATATAAARSEEDR